MAPALLMYFVHVNAGIAFFYLLYKWLCTRDTFFTCRRGILLLSIISAFVLPSPVLAEWIGGYSSLSAVTGYYRSVLLTEVVSDGSGTTWMNGACMCFFLVYLAGGVLCLFRILLKVASLIVLVFQSESAELNGIKVRLIQSVSGPFSFFGWIFIPKEKLGMEEVSDMLVHEQAHVKQYHSVDVLLSEIVCSVLWLNPFGWLLKREVKENLEYLADRKVLESGTDRKAYQYHLLRTSCSRGYVLVNAFNVSSLKRRIRMMNCKRTSGVGYLKYSLWVIPVMALLVAGNVFVMTEYSEFLQLLKKEIQCPQSVSDKGMQGRVIVQFEVERDGYSRSFQNHSFRFSGAGCRSAACISVDVPLEVCYGQEKVGKRSVYGSGDFYTTLRVSMNLLQTDFYIFIIHLSILLVSSLKFTPTLMTFLPSAAKGAA